MNYIIESLLVGIYTWFIYMICSIFIKNLFFLLLVVGFSKHFLGSSLGIHDWYCNNGDACIKSLQQPLKIYKANTKHLIRDSLLEATAFLIIGYFLKSIKLTNNILFFTIGVILHIAAEKLLVHKYFCETTCTIKKAN